MYGFVPESAIVNSGNGIGLDVPKVLGSSPIVLDEEAGRSTSDVVEGENCC